MNRVAVPQAAAPTILPAAPARRIRRWPWALGAAVCVGVVVFSLWTARDASMARVESERALGRARDTLLDARIGLTAEGHRVARDHAELAARSRERDAVSAIVTVDRAGLAGASQELAGARQVEQDQNIRLLAITQCLGGARGALDATAFGDSVTATSRLQAVSAPCRLAISVGDPDAPLFGLDFADPYVLRVGTDYYAFATNAGGGAVQVIHSTDLANWTLSGSALGNLPVWAAKNSTWAPAVVARPGGYLLYYTVHEALTGRQCLSMAFGTAPGGPYIDSSSGPLECGTGGAIDPSPFVAADGRLYLLWKTEGPPRIWSRALTGDGRAFAGPAHLLASPTQRWEAGNVEAPAMLANGGATGCSSRATTGTAPATPRGSCTALRPSGRATTARETLLLASHDSVAGPGGGEVFQDAGGGWWLAYHAYRVPDIGYPNSRLFRLARLTFTPGGAPALPR